MIDRTRLCTTIFAYIPCNSVHYYAVMRSSERTAATVHGHSCIDLVSVKIERNAVWHTRLCSMLFYSLRDAWSILLRLNKIPDILTKTWMTYWTSFLLYFFRILRRFKEVEIFILRSKNFLKILHNMIAKYFCLFYKSKLY